MGSTENDVRPDGCCEHCCCRGCHRQHCRCCQQIPVELGWPAIVFFAVLTAAATWISVGSPTPW